MKSKMSLIEFLGIPPRTYEIDVTESEIEDSSSNLEDISVPTVNPCSGLPVVDSQSLIDIEGNAFGTCNEFDTCIATVDEMHLLSDPLIETHSSNDLIETTSVMSVETDSFDDVTTSTYLDDGFSDESLDDSFINDWSEW